MRNCHFNFKKVLQGAKIFNRKSMLKCGHAMRNGLNIIFYNNKIMIIYKNHQCLLGPRWTNKNELALVLVKPIFSRTTLNLVCQAHRDCFSP